MSPRPTNAIGNRSRSPKIPASTSTYLGDAMLPSSTTSQSGPICASSVRALASSGRRYVALSGSTSPRANARTAVCVTSVSGLRNPAFGVITCTPAPTMGLVGWGGCANRRAYVSLPRKYRPLMNVNRSPSGAPFRDRSAAATGKVAPGESTCFARRPPQLAGESRKTRFIAFPNADSAQRTQVGRPFQGRRSAGLNASPCARRVLAVVGVRSKSPAQQYRTHREAGAHRREQHELAFPEPARADRVVQRERDGRGRRVAEPLDVDDDLTRVDAELLGRRLDDPAVGLMRDEEIDVAGRPAVALQDPPRDLLGLPHRELEDGLPVLFHVMQALIDRVVRRRLETASCRHAERR